MGYHFHIAIGKKSKLDLIRNMSMDELKEKYKDDEGYIYGYEIMEKNTEELAYITDFYPYHKRCESFFKKEEVQKDEIFNDMFEAYVLSKQNIIDLINLYNARVHGYYKEHQKRINKARSKEVLKEKSKKQRVKISLDYESTLWELLGDNHHNFRFTGQKYKLKDNKITHSKFIEKNGYGGMLDTRGNKYFIYEGNSNFEFQIAGLVNLLNWLDWENNYVVVYAW